MKNIELILQMTAFVTFIVAVIGVLLKVPMIMHRHVYERKIGPTGIMLGLNMVGNWLLIVAPISLIIGATYSVAYTPRSDPYGTYGTGPSLLPNWMGFAIMSVLFTLTYLAGLVCIRNLLRLPGEIFDGCSKFLCELISSISLPKVSSVNQSGKKSSIKSVAEQFGYDLAKGQIQGMEENLPGNEWKHPKEEEKDDDDTDPGGGFERSRGPKDPGLN